MHKLLSSNWKNYCLAWLIFSNPILWNKFLSILKHYHLNNLLLYFGKFYFEICMISMSSLSFKCLVYLMISRAARNPSGHMQHCWKNITLTLKMILTVRWRIVAKLLKMQHVLSTLRIQLDFKITGIDLNPVEILLLRISLIQRQNVDGETSVF